MSEPTTRTPSAEGSDLLLDEFSEKLAAFQALRKTDSKQADELLSTLGASDEVDHDIVLELSSRAPLGHPDRFPEAHSMAVRALEVLDRNGPRPVRMSGLGIFNPVAAFLVQQVASFIVRTHQAAVAEEMLLLYARREANCLPNEPSRHMLWRARRDMEQVTPGLKRNAVGVPTFLLGGAVFSTLMSLLQRSTTAALHSLLGRIVATIILSLIMVGVAWVILRGAAVARRRTQLTLDKPINALWQTIGRAGTPPRDPSRMIALIAIVLALLPWLLIPTGLLVSWVTAL
jgi:hypothetical protein